MSQTTTNKETTTENTENKKPYHTPQLHKFGNVSELTHTNGFPGTGNDGGSGFNQYSS